MTKIVKIENCPECPFAVSRKIGLKCDKLKTRNTDVSVDYMVPTKGVRTDCPLEDTPDIIGLVTDAIDFNGEYEQAIGRAGEEYAGGYIEGLRDGKDITVRTIAEKIGGKGA